MAAEHYRGVGILSPHPWAHSRGAIRRTLFLLRAYSGTSNRGRLGTITCLA